MRFVFQTEHNNNSRRLMWEGRELPASCHVTNSYVELEVQMDDGNFEVVYYIPRDRHSFFVLANLEDCLNPLLLNIKTKYDIDSLFEVSPTIKHLLENTSEEKYSKGVLLRIADLDTGDGIWVIVSIVANVNFDSLDALFNEKSQKSKDVVVRSAAKIFSEVTTCQIKAGKEIWRGFLEGISLVLRIAGPSIASYVTDMLIGGIIHPLPGQSPDSR